MGHNQSLRVLVSEATASAQQQSGAVMFLGRCRFQIVHTHDLYANVLGIPAATMARVPVIISSQRDLGHLDFYKSKRRMWLRRLQKLSTAGWEACTAV